MISFVVPAHNEQAGIGRTLRAIHDAAGVIGQPYEIIVVDDASTDATAEVASQHGAIVVPVNHRQIAATRNSGARSTRGERLIFVDADTTINARTVAAALRQMDHGAAGGGAPVRFDGAVPLYASLLLWWLGWIMRLVGISGGAFLFCTTEAFHAVGGFDERLFGAEDVAISWALKRQGRFVVLWRHVRTSGRRMQGIHGLRMVAALIRVAFLPQTLRRRQRVQKIWYASDREVDGKTTDSLVVRFANIGLLLIIVLVILGPLWNLIPGPLTPEGSALCQIRLGVAIFNCHVGLVLWPCVYFLTRILIRQKRWVERVKLVAFIAICCWGAWGATEGVVWFWTSIYDALT